MIMPDVKVTLPLGISFYTFQIAAYAIDVYRRPSEHTKSFVDLGTYLCMFPQLIAGPIVLFSDVRRQLKSQMCIRDRKYSVSEEHHEKSITLVTLGKKGEPPKIETLSLIHIFPAQEALSLSCSALKKRMRMETRQTAPQPKRLLQTAPK